MVVRNSASSSHASLKRRLNFDVPSICTQLRNLRTRIASWCMIASSLPRPVAHARRFSNCAGRRTSGSPGTCSLVAQDVQSWLAAHNMTFGREAHMTDDSHRFTPIDDVAKHNAVPLHEGKTFHQFTDRWKAEPRYAINVEAMADKPGWLRASGHYRLAFREISRSTDERTMIAAIIPPGHVFGHKATCEKAPWKRPDAAALVLCAVFNSFTFDWCLRRKIAASVSLFMLNGCPAPVAVEGSDPVPCPWRLATVLPSCRLCKIVARNNWVLLDRSSPIRGSERCGDASRCDGCCCGTRLWPRTR